LRGPDDPRKRDVGDAPETLILETAAKYGVPVDMLWKPTGGSNAITKA
jgi:hypothetical protein